MRKFVVVPAIIIEAEDAAEAVSKVVEALTIPVREISAGYSAGLMILGVPEVGGDTIADPASEVFRDIMRAPDAKEGA